MRAMQQKWFAPSMIFHHDNAPSHRSATQTAVRQLGFEFLRHPPYSPDSSHCDFDLFPVMKTNLKGIQFDDTHELSAAVQVAIFNIQQNLFRRVLSSHGLSDAGSVSHLMEIILKRTERF